MGSGGFIGSGGCGGPCLDLPVHPPRVFPIARRCRAAETGAPPYAFDRELATCKPTLGGRFHASRRRPRSWLLGSPGVCGRRVRLRGARPASFLTAGLRGRETPRRGNRTRVATFRTVAQ